MTSAWARHLPPGIDPATLDLLAERSLPAAWAARWASDPAVPAIGDGRTWVTAADLEDRTRRVAGRLVGAGVQPGDRVVVSGSASIDLVTAHVAALRAGLVVVPVNTAYREREVAQIARDCRPAAAVVDDPAVAGWIADASPSPVVTCGPAVDLPDGPAPELDTCAPADDAMLCYTSGTTGTPKGARLSHANLLASPAALALAWRWTPDDRLVLALPLFHVHGLAIGLHGTLLAGASAVLVPRFAPDAVLDAARTERATLFFGVPTMYDRLAKSARASELARLRLCVSGSAPLPPALFERLQVDAGITVLERYGMTETLMTVSNPYDGERRAGTVGFPLPGVDIELADDGELLVRGPNVFGGYWERPDTDDTSFVPADDGGARWFRTGDVAALDEDGYLSIVGRTKELIISGGFNVYPREVEDVLRTCPGVGDVAVVGTPSEEWGEVVTAVVVADGPLDTDALLALAADQLAPYKRPRVVRVVDELPRNALGKVLRHEL
ncbi:MAG: AMP-binding protein [Acidimicrobiia bacterium]